MVMESRNKARGSADPSSVVCEQLRGKHVLLTGTTGFLGKVVLEKLMRSVPDIGGIHLLIRSSDNYGNARDRFRGDIASSSVFEELKLNQPDYFDSFCEHRIHCHTGEITMPLFGLTRTGFDALADQTDAIINAAASVNFREALDTALTINTLCLNNIVELSRCAGDIPVIQVSTCYVNGFNNGHIPEEVVRPASGRLKRHPNGYYPVGDLIRVLQDKIEDLRSRYTGEALADKLVELGVKEANGYGWNDTYTFTKWMGEQWLLEYMRGGSLTILRPSIIESTLREPVRGWIEGVKVGDAIIMGYARQKVVFFPGRREGVVDIIPADLVANSIILSLAEQFKVPGQQRIYQSCSGSSRPVTLGELIDLVVAEGQRNYKSYDRLFLARPRMPFKAVNQAVFNAVTRGSRLPLRALNQGLRLLGRGNDSEAMDRLDTTLKLARIFGFYTCPRYVFHNDRLLDLAERMGSRDKTLFPVDPRRIDWAEYIQRIHLTGLNRYALQERKLYRLKAGNGKRRVA